MIISYNEKWIKFSKKHWMNVNLNSVLLNHVFWKEFWIISYDRYPWTSTNITEPEQDQIIIVSMHSHNPGLETDPEPVLDAVAGSKRLMA